MEGQDLLVLMERVDQLMEVMVDLEAGVVMEEGEAMAGMAVQLVTARKEVTSRSISQLFHSRLTLSSKFLMIACFTC